MASDGDHWTQALRDAADQIGHSPSIVEYQRLRSEGVVDGPASSSIRRAYGTWNDAKRAAGLDTVAAKGGPK